MNIEEIKTLGDEDLGRRLAQSAGLVCHRFSFRSINKMNIGEVVSAHYAVKFTTLCQSLDAIAEVERIVIEKVGLKRFIGAYFDVVTSLDDFDYMTYDACRILLFLTARQRAESCLLALQEKEQ